MADPGMAFLLKKLVTPREAVGKTVEAFVRSKDGDCLLIAWVDGTFTLLSGSFESLRNFHLSWFDTDQLARLGFVDQIALNEHREAERRLNEKRQALEKGRLRAKFVVAREKMFFDPVVQEVDRYVDSLRLEPVHALELKESLLSCDLLRIPDVDASAPGPKGDACPVCHRPSLVHPLDWPGSGDQYPVRRVLCNGYPFVGSLGVG